MKKTLIIILIILTTIILSVYSIDECKPVMNNKESMNCTVTSVWNYTGTCETHNATVYNITGNNIINYTFQNFSTTGLCFFYWNITQIGSYFYLIDVGDSGQIKVEATNNMLAIVLGLSFIALVFFSIGMFLCKGVGLKIFSYGITLSQVIIMAYLLYINELSESLMPLLQLNFIILFIIIGGIALISVLLFMFNTVSLENEGNEGEEKWLRSGGKW